MAEDKPTVWNSKGNSPMPDSDRYSRGVQVMETIQGRQAGDAIRASFDEVSPDFGRYVVEVYGPLD